MLSGEALSIAGRFGASPEEITQDRDIATFPESEPSRYREGWLPS